MPEDYHILELAEKFNLPSQVTKTEPLKFGHINDTHILYSGNFEHKFILQRINSYVFHDIPGLMGNVSRVLDFIHTKDSESAYPVLYKTKDNNCFFQGPRQEYWRVYSYVSNSKSYLQCKSTEHAFKAAKAAGYFLSLISELPPQDFAITIPKFHDLHNRYLQFEDAVEADSANRAKEVQEEIDFAFKRQSLSQAVHDFPERLVHNDMKFNNVLFDNNSDEAIAVVDYDTIMSGTILYDFGDLVRSAGTPALEDEQDLSKVYLDIDYYQALLGGYTYYLKDILSPTEIKSLYLAPQYITLMIGLRFLTDYLNGDKYFKTSYRQHNLNRAKNQFELLKSMEKQEVAMKCSVT